jgi:hypothetical protein
VRNQRSFFAKKACGSVSFGVDYAVTFWREKTDILTLLAI